jgi:PAS domain S-box-containing protein
MSITDNKITESLPEGISEFLDMMPIGVIYLDNAGHIIRANTAFAAVINRSTVDINGTTFADYLNSADSDSFMTALSSGTPCQVEARLTGEKWYALDIMPVTGGLMVTATDITALKAREASLTEQRDQFKFMTDNSYDVMSIFDANSAVIYMSPSVLRHTGYTPEEFISKTFRDFIHPDDLERVTNEMMQKVFIERNKHCVITMRHRTKDGSYIWAEGRTSVIYDEDNNIKYGIQISRDITTQVLLEQELRNRTEELSIANAELTRMAHLKDDFLASMSHELRTPLTAILMLSETLQLGLVGQLTDDQVKIIKMLEDSGRHLLSLINDILDLSKIEVNKLTLDKSPVNIGDCCHASMAMIREAAQRKDIQISYSVDPAVNILMADERRLKQMLVNLLSNSVKFTPNQGSVTLTVTSNRESDSVQFTVTDTGIGISLDDQQLLFQPFVQIDSRLSREYTGTGLGLSLVKRMAELHNGSVSLVSEPGQGSSFTINLPWISPENSCIPLENIVCEPCEVIKNKDGDVPLVLIAEDHEVLLDLLEGFLQSQGYRTATARNGLQVMEQARALSPDIILMDIQMPGIDGIEAEHDGCARTK